MGKRKRKKTKVKHRLIKFLVILSIILLACSTLYYFIKPSITISKLKKIQVPEYVDVQLLPIGGSRKGIELTSVDNIVIHYVGNTNTTAQQNHDYFGNRGTIVNSHFIVGLDGEIIQCVPIFERSVASNHRNKDTISIEVCHPDSTGEFNKATYDSLIKLTAWLCKICDLDARDVIRHYDITGKMCPLYYVINESAWEIMLNDIAAEIKKES